MGTDIKVVSAFYRAGRKWKCEIDKMRTGNAANIRHFSPHTSPSGKNFGANSTWNLWLNTKGGNAQQQQKQKRQRTHSDKIKRRTTFIA